MNKQKLLLGVTATTLLLGVAITGQTQAEEKLDLIDKVMTEKPYDKITNGGSVMSPKKNIVENASTSKEHTTLVTALEATGLDPVLKGKGPYTVFAPTNTAFEKLPAGTINSLLKPENKEQLSQILQHHVVAGKLTSADLKEKAGKMDGEVVLNTLGGDQITLTEDKIGNWTVIDAKGGKAKIKQADLMQSNGVIFVTDSVFMPKS